MKRSIFHAVNIAVALSVHKGRGQSGDDLAAMTDAVSAIEFLLDQLVAEGLERNPATYAESQDKFLEALQAILEIAEEPFDNFQQIRLITAQRPSINPH